MRNPKNRNGGFGDVMHTQSSSPRRAQHAVTLTEIRTIVIFFDKMLICFRS